MNKRAARILILFLVFAASVGVFTHLMSHETTENATDLDAASLPVLYMKTADTTVNRMYGYRQEMNGITTRENLTPLPMDRSLTLEIDAKGQKIKNVTYTVESTDGGALIENSVLKSFDEDGSYLKADFQLETAILMNQEYTLKLEVAYGDGQSAWYYTRIVQRNGVEVGDYLAYTQMFAQTCLDKTQAEALVPQLEPDETGDNSSFLNVNIHSSLDQISWGSLAPTIVQQPVQQIKEANETTTSITQEYMISAQDENGQTEYYTVSEFYRMRESDGEIILLDFERSAQQIFDPELGVLTKSGINLGVAGEDTEYCDGRQVQCRNRGWMTQWGSKSLGDQGYSPIEILRYFYGNDIYVNVAEAVSGIPSSWPGYDLNIGATGNKVRQIQEQLNVISDAYPAIPKVGVDGIYGEQTKNSVRKFQDVFGLPETGITDYPTWYKIQEIYVAVSRIAELN